MKVTLVYDPVWQALEWAKEHCPSYITNKVYQSGTNNFSLDNTKIDYFFGDISDAVLFKLTWG